LNQPNHPEYSRNLTTNNGGAKSTTGIRLFLTYEAANLKIRGDWFEPVLNTNTPHSPPSDPPIFNGPLFNSVMVKVKVKLTLEQATTAQRGRTGMALLFL